MGVWRRTMAGVTAGLAAFKEAYTSSVPGHEETFGTIAARRARYAIFWGMFENSAYRDIHRWATALRHQFALYKYVRSLYCPAWRIGSFYASHLWGGRLDPDAGNEGAIPIETENDKLRPAIAALWAATNFGARKDIIALRGTILGDTILRVIDDTEKERVYLYRVDPSTVVELTLDSFGNVKGYVIEEERPNPENELQTVTYRLVVSRDGENVVYETFLNDAPYGWEGKPEAWASPYTFVPAVLIKHLDVGLPWGWSELHPMRALVYEVDDLASMISDQIRKAVDPLWHMKGMTKKQLIISGASGSSARPQPGREELKAIWSSNADAKAEAMIAPLNLASALAHVVNLLKEMERNYPELQQDIWSVGATSGRALRVARQRVDAKVLQRREGYDMGLVKSQQMAIAIGGFRKYKGYDGFDLTSYGKGDLDHRIAARPVFAADPMDEAEIAQALWQAAATAVNAEADLAGFLRAFGWPEAKIAMVVKKVVGKPVEEGSGEE